MIDKLFDQIAQQGLSLTLLAVAVFYLKSKISECEQDRKALWEKLLNESKR
jgi:uncharacterized membrane protein YciS (DUF1049 family)